MKGDTFSLLTSSVEAVTNLTEAASTFLATHQLDGLEVDWRWPSHAKEREDLTTLIKVSQGRKRKEKGRKGEERGGKGRKGEKRGGKRGRKGRRMSCFVYR